MWVHTCGHIHVFASQTIKIQTEIFIFLEPVYEATACEFEIYSYGIETMSCPSNKHIQVKSAMYGTPNFRGIDDVSRCQPRDSWFNWLGYDTGECETDYDLTEFAREECNGKTKCLFRGSKDLLGNPCWGIYKYTRLLYQCVANNGKLR